MRIKSKIFTFSSGFGFIKNKSEEIENALNVFIEKNEINEKEIISVTQSESEGKLLTITFLYKD
ncbi:hypothetical protein NOL18_23620 [Vibrio parahaemolyticus]|uniref:Uncharacterized protein n=1 Tax=Vibrio navarrensis TaxID=29495 RepID=A0AAI9CYH0_9VIBR|nr:hypothetical protein [Vibrio parahaemolyticus]EGR2798239.1 hypothetical protein [Vibrio navarrensis]EHA1127734.1 hypothetical protein [Vibrio navarrensis]EJL6396904.1 hypothetical protein [Vibrio navarrensis]ELN6934695.1 hypothetical protein [Vibrio navarrensis]MCX8880110.1 hypothetical protein [Vibrio parahaemolyticus]